MYRSVPTHDPMAPARLSRMFPAPRGPCTFRPSCKRLSVSLRAKESIPGSPGTASLVRYGIREATLAGESEARRSRGQHWRLQDDLCELRVGNAREIQLRPRCG